VEQSLRQQYEYIFAGLTYPGIPKVRIRTIKNEAFTIGDIEFIPIQVMHYKLPVLGFRIGDFTYITDANFISPKERTKASNSKFLVLNALHHKPHISHFNLEEAKAVSKIIGAEQTYFTHISHYMGLHDSINKTLSNDMKLAFDGLQLKV
jgi:phosphoribosyl 1,2-cyclic phosphate phosphodiesterase